MMTDIIVIGGGPAGMTAALYAQRNGKNALVLEKHGFGGQITYSPKVENWPGTAQMSGNEYAEALLDQIMAQGAEVDLAEVIRIEDHGSFKRIFTDDGLERDAKAVIIAAGVTSFVLQNSTRVLSCQTNRQPVCELYLQLSTLAPL